MQEKNYTGIVPDQNSGVPIDTESVVTLDTADQAKALYQAARTRLLDVNNWHQTAGNFSARFQVVDEQGQPVNGPAREHCYFRIDIPGPGNEAGEGFDWVKIEAVESTSSGDVESTGIRVRPASNPLKPEDDSVAHFYSRESTSNFTVTREGNRVTAAIYDRNTKPNTDTKGVLDTVRDALVGMGGIIGFSKIQWKSLADGLIKQP